MQYGDSTSRLLPPVASADDVAQEQERTRIDSLSEPCLTETEHVQLFPEQQEVHLVQVCREGAHVEVANFQGSR